METLSVSEIKKILSSREPHELTAICLRIIKYKKENKELMSYILHESGDETLFIEKVKSEMDEMFDAIIYGTAYKYAKQVRKILRFINKQIKFSGLPTTQIELLIQFCSTLLPEVKSRRSQTSLINLYGQQIKKIGIAMAKIHEDLQFDYQSEMDKLGLVWEI